MAKYPIFLELKHRRAVVIGAGAVALRKARSLLNTGARLVVVAEHIDNLLRAFSRDTSIRLIRSAYSRDYLAGATLAIAATKNPQLNKQIYEDCQQLQVLCNVVDQPELCNFFVPAVVHRGNLQIAISTEGTCPAYACHLRKKIERTFTEKHRRFLAELETSRLHIIKNLQNTADRKTILGQLVDDDSFEYFNHHGPDAWRRRTEETLKQYQTPG